MARLFYNLIRIFVIILSQIQLLCLKNKAKIRIRIFASIFCSIF